jgi:hypothetical protein
VAIRLSIPTRARKRSEAPQVRRRRFHWKGGVADLTTHAVCFEQQVDEH